MGAMVDGLKRAWVAVERYGTDAIAFVTGTIAAVAGVTGLIPEPHLKYYMGAIAVLTFWRGLLERQKRPA